MAGEFKSLGEWAKAVRAVETGGPVDPRLVPCEQEPSARFTEAELAELEKLADELVTTEPSS